jgi:hypothetical protein
MLQPGESIVTSIWATQCDPPTAKSGTVSGCLAITNQRVIFAGKAITKAINRTIPLAQVSSLELSKGMMTFCEILLELVRPALWQVASQGLGLCELSQLLRGQTNRGALGLCSVALVKFTPACFGELQRWKSWVEFSCHEQR